ncbi:hypothetical protein C0075_13695 [Rhizobium sp. KAs_5_22]|uniref:hypothetical protein n=1 Tax=Ciceribacter selenitireducens TaxID=448181 RepID=UPI00048A7CC0|nr:hypothetical protein [Ciceribacter selenitireducens]PPJ46692.1 hypothetical protein C0075_13695 [Rhizobium sp. KAs_5_22]
MELVRTFWDALPRMPASVFHYAWLLALVGIMPAFLYGQHLGQKAVNEGRARLWLGMISRPTSSRELKREAGSGDRIALYVLRIRNLAVAVLLVVLVWPKQSA